MLTVPESAAATSSLWMLFSTQNGVAFSSSILHTPFSQACVSDGQLQLGVQGSLVMHRALQCNKGGFLMVGIAKARLLMHSKLCIEACTLHSGAHTLHAVPAQVPISFCSPTVQGSPGDCGWQVSVSRSQVPHGAGQLLAGSQVTCRQNEIQSFIVSLMRGSNCCVC